MLLMEHGFLGVPQASYEALGLAKKPPRTMAISFLFGTKGGTRKACRKAARLFRLSSAFSLVCLAVYSFGFRWSDGAGFV